MKNRRFTLTFASIIIISLAAPLHADTYIWNGSTTGGGTGIDNTWDTITANWTGAGPTWPSISTGNDDASFGGTAGTLAISGTISANDIAFSTTAYKLGADGSTGIIILDGTNPTITTPASGGSTIDVGATLQGSAGLIKAGSVTLQLRNSNTYSGSTQVLGGTLLIGAGNNRLPTSTNLILGNGATNANAVFQMNSRSQQVGGLETAGTGTGNRIINGSTAATTFTVNNASNHTFGGILGGTGTNHNNFAFTKSGLGRLTLTNTNTYTGTTTISSGTLELAHATNTIPDSGAVNVNGGTLDISDKSETIGALTITSGSITGTTGVLSALSCAGKAGTVSAVLASSVNLSGSNTTWLTKDTAGTLELSAANAFTGNITITTGRLTLSNSAALGVADPTPGGTNRKGIIMQGTGRSLWLKGGITIPANIDFFVSSTSADTGGINNESGNNEIQSPINFSTGNGALNISSSADTLTISGNITQTASDRTLYLGGASVSDNTISGNITENNAANILPVVKQGAGKWILSGTNTYKGDTTINGGTLVLANGSSTRFLPKSDVSSNKITGNGSGLITLDGALNIDLADTITAPDNSSWLLIDVDNVEETYGTNFTVTGFSLGTAGTWTKTESGRLFTFTQGDGRLVVTPAVGNTYATWLAANAPATGFVTDSDFDGVPNGVEHILGSNPNASSAGLANISATSSSATFTHSLNPNLATDVSYTYEWSADLVEWKDSGIANTAGTIATIVPSAPVSGVVTVTTTITSGTANKLFTRIKATQP